MKVSSLRRFLSLMIFSFRRTVSFFSLIMWSITYVYLSRPYSVVGNGAGTVLGEPFACLIKYWSYSLFLCLCRLYGLILSSVMAAVKSNV